VLPGDGHPRLKTEEECERARERERKREREKERECVRERESERERGRERDGVYVYLKVIYPRATNIYTTVLSRYFVRAATPATRV